MKKLVIDPHNCSREEYEELKKYLESQSWDWKELAPAPKPMVERAKDDVLYLIGEYLDRPYLPPLQRIHAIEQAMEELKQAKEQTDG